MEKRLNFSLTLFTFLLIASLSIFTLPKDAEAITVKLKNPYPHNMAVAIIYYDNSINNWLVRGWYNVTPKTTRTVNFNNSTKMNTVWIHAHTSEASWGSQRKYTVIKETFKYIAGKACPQGTGRRVVGFDKWFIDNTGVVNWYPQKQ